MMNNNEFLFLFKYYIKNWRLLFSVILIACVVSCGMAFGKGVVGNESDVVQSETNPLLDVQAIKIAYFQYGMLENQKNSIENALYMQINASSVNEKILTYSIKAEDEEKKAELIELYEGILDDGELLNTVQQLCDDSQIESLSDIIFINNAEEDNLVRIKICSYSEESVEKIASAIKDYINSSKSVHAFEQNEVEVNLISEYFIVQREPDLEDIQANSLVKLKNLNVLYDDYYSSLSSEEKEYLDDLKSEEIGLQELSEKLTESDIALATSTKEEMTIVEMAKLMLENLLNAVIISIFIYVIIVYIKFSVNSRLQASKEMEELFGIKVLGKFAVKSKGKFGKRLDQIIARVMEERIDNDFELARIKRYLHALETEYNKLFVFTNNEDVSILQKIQNDMKRQLSIVSDYMNCSELIEGEENKFAVVIAVKLEKTKYEEITRQLKFCEEMQANIIGAIVLEER